VNFVACLLVGGILGWVANYFMQPEHPRGLTNSIAMGVTAALVGLWVTSPLVSAGTASTVPFSNASLLISTGFAVALLGVMHLVRRVRCE
jgi:uncharacterized membrane protein YeaQ/YmgE (transglycosylase-associated protein family)